MNLPKTLFFDIDGTLLDPLTQKIPESAIKALNALANQGYAICIASGRDPVMLKTLGIEKLVKWKFFVLVNGHVILDEHLKIIRHHLFEPNTVRRVIECAKSHGITVYLGGPHGDIMCGQPTRYVKIAHDYFKEPIPPIKTYAGEPIDKILLYEQIGFDWTIFSDLTDLDIIPSTTTCADVTKKGISKHTSILDVLMTHGYSDYYIAFGDSMNDYEMLQHAPISIAMGNGVDEVKKIAHYIADRVENDGLAKMLSQLGYMVD